MTVALVALFVALSGTAVAAGVVPLAKHALVADNAKKLQGKSSAALVSQASAVPGPATDALTLTGQTAQQIAATPGPASSIAASTFTMRTNTWSLSVEGSKIEERALCTTGERAIAGGFDEATGYAEVIQDRPLADASGWMFKAWALSGDETPAEGTVWVICAKLAP
jgi:hypothetical protein